MTSFTLRLTRFVATVANVLSAPSAAPAFAKLPSMAIYSKNCSALLAIFWAAHFGSNRVAKNLSITVKQKRLAVSDKSLLWDWHDSNVRPPPPQSVSISQKHSMLLYTKLILIIFYCIIRKNTRLDFFVVLSIFESYRVILSLYPIFYPIEYLFY